MTKEEERAKIDYRENLSRYFDKIVERFSTQDMDPGLISDQLKEHTEITPEDSAPKLLFIASDITYFNLMQLEDLPSLYNMKENPIKVHCILVDDDIEQLKKFIEKVPNDIEDISANLSPEFRKYNNKKDIANNIDELRKTVKTYLENKEGLPIILLDLNLKGSNKEGLQLGEMFFRIVRNEWPQIPIFALTRYRDINTILRMGHLGANGYIYKPSIGLLPLYLGLFLKEKIGEQVIEFLLNNDPEKKHLNMVLQHITAWTNMPHVLWYGDKVPIMVEHGITHASNLWSLFNSLLSVIDYRKGFLNLSKENALAFMMSLWLHDIGHKGNEYYQSGPDVRSYHGAISSSLIGARPDVYLPYLHCDEDNNWSDIIERIQIFCRFHSSNGPLDEESFKQLQEKGMLSEPYELGSLPIVSSRHLQSIKFSIPLCVMEDKVTSIKYAIVPEEMRPSVALFRFLDALDMRANRVGDPYYLKVKQDTITREMECIYRDILDAGNNLEIEFSRLYPTYQSELIQAHGQISEINRILKDILDMQKKVNTLRTGQDDSKNPLNHPFLYWGMSSWFESKKEDIEGKLSGCMKAIIQDGKSSTSNALKWRNLVDYFVMLSIQCKHFYLHKTFRNISFKKKENNISIDYILDKPLPSKEDYDELIRWIIDCAQGISSAWKYVNKEWDKTSRYISEAISISDIKFTFPGADNNTLSFPLSLQNREYFSEVLEKILSVVFDNIDIKIEIKLADKTFGIESMVGAFESLIKKETLDGIEVKGYIKDLREL